MKKIVVAGIGTDVGKTVVSGILATLFKADYWKPLQCGSEGDSDSKTLEAWLSPTQQLVHPPAYSLKEALSPHHAARLEKIELNPKTIKLPKTTRSLIIEGPGGVLVPLTNSITTWDVFQKWDCEWVVVSKHYVGSINHTLLTLNLLKQHHIPIKGLIFNGEPNPDSEKAILSISNVPFLERVLFEKHINTQTIQRYATQWQHSIRL